MAVAYASSTSTGVGDSFVSSINVPVPSGVVAGNHVYVALEQWESSNPTVTMPSGFALLGQVVSGSQKLKVLWKEATASDTGNYTFSWAGSQWTIGHAVRVTGAKAGNPTGTNFNTATSASGTSIPNTSVTVGFIPGLLHFVANENSATHTAPTNFTEVQESNYLASNHRTDASASGTFTAPGGTLSTSTLSLAFLVAIEPAAAGGAVALDGIGLAASSASGALSTDRALTGSSAAASLATGNLATDRPLSGAGSVAASASGVLTADRALSGTSAAASSADGQLSSERILSGQANAAASADGQLAAARTFSGIAASASSAAGNLTVLGPSSGSVFECGRLPRTVWKAQDPAPVWSAGSSPVAVWRSGP